LKTGKGVGLVTGPVGDGDATDATVTHRLDGESLMCIAFAGPQPNGVAVSRTMPMTATVTTVMTTAAATRWIMPLLANQVKGYWGRNGYVGFDSSCATRAWLAGSKRLSSSAERAADRASSRRPS
jgi:hypothetical protein